MDTHPPLEQRLAALGTTSQSIATTANSCPAIDLVNDLDAVEASLVPYLRPGLGGRLRKPIPWSEVGSKVALADCRRGTTRHAQHLTGMTMGSLPADKNTLLVWAREVFRGSESATEEQLINEAVGLAICAGIVCLADNGWSIDSLPGQSVVAHKDGHQLCPAALIDNGTTPQAWIEACERVGVSALSVAPVGPTDDGTKKPRRKNPSGRRRHGPRGRRPHPTPESRVQASTESDRV